MSPTRSPQHRATHLRQLIRLILPGNSSPEHLIAPAYRLRSQGLEAPYPHVVAKSLRLLRQPASQDDLRTEMEPLDTPDYTRSDHVEGPARRAEGLTVVGIGAAEGGGEALIRLFEQSRPGNALSYIVVATVPDEQLRRLAEQIRQVTAIDVGLVEGQTELRADHIYVVPLGQHPLFSGSTMWLDEAEPTPGQRVAIDLTLRAIAECFHEHTIAVILSGAGSDGSLGLSRIKEAGGMTLAQEPGEASLSAMPRAAIATGYVDYVLPAALIPAQIVSFLASGQRLPAELGPPNTERPTKIPALMRDLLSSVTNSFRDPEVYQAIEALLPDLLAMKGPTDSVRAWVELTTVNQELKHKVDEISRVNADLQNLMASTEIGTIFLDRDLRVKRYTPRVQDIFNLIATDLNRPLAHLTHRLTYPGLVDEAAQVLERLAPIDREVQHADGRWFMVRLLPYRTIEDRIDGVVLTFIDITAHKQGAQALQEAKQQLEARVAERTAALEAEVAERRQSDATRRELMRRLVTAQEEERRRISREIHDQLGQQLAALLLGLRALKQISQGRASTLAQIGQLESLVGQISEEMGQLARTLRPTLLDDLGLTAALNAYTEEWSRRTGVAVAFHSNMLDSARLPPTVETTIYRVVLEALLNVFKHARASQVSLILEQREDSAVAIIEDNGQGFDAELVLERPAQWGLGLLGMRERVELVDGTMTIESAEGSGTTVFVHIPISGQQAEGSDGEAADLSSR